MTVQRYGGRVVVTELAEAAPTCEAFEDFFVPGVVRRSETFPVFDVRVRAVLEKQRDKIFFAADCGPVKCSLPFTFDSIRIGAGLQ